MTGYVGQSNTLCQIGVSWKNGDMRVGGTVRGACRAVSLHWSMLMGNEGQAHVGLSNTVAGGGMNDRFT